MKHTVAALALLLSVAACGDGDDDDMHVHDASGMDTSAADASPDAGADAAPARNPLGQVAPGVGDDPLSSMVAVTLRGGVGAANIARHVKNQVDLVATGQLPAGTEFPLTASVSDSLRVIDGLQANVVVRWLDPLTRGEMAESPRFGANNDFIGYFGEGWEADGTPLYGGNANRAWVWSNHEYISGLMPTTTSAPVGQHLTFARFLAATGILTNDVTAQVWAQDDVDTYIRWYKRQVGGSWFRAVQDPATKEWWIDRDAEAMRYDATDSTLLNVTGHSLSKAATRADGSVLPAGIVPGIMADCSGGVTPWGTVISAEENVQYYYGDLETAWTGDQKFVTGVGFDPGAPISYTFEPSTSGDFGRSSVPAERHNRDMYGYLAEIDPGVTGSEYYGKSSASVGHRKLGVAGRARWENATVATGADWKLMPGKPIVLYAGDDRRSGRVWKIVTTEPYTSGMSKAQVRALLDAADLYVAHFEGIDVATGTTLAATSQIPTEDAPGVGRWVKVSTTSTDIAPNAAALGVPGKTVGQALTDVTWNDIGGFADDNAVRNALFTAANKLGVAEMNRPEDIEYNPIGTPRIYIGFTNHTRQVAADQNGVLFDPATHAVNSPKRGDREGSIFALEEVDTTNPGATTTFEYWIVWRGSQGDGVFDAANPDNLAIDADGGVWFGTDGNLGTNGHADALYYLDLDPAHRDGSPGVVMETFGKAFRVAAVPSDAEATGPAFNSDMGTLFFNVQHPGEDVPSSWPARNLSTP